MQRFPRFSILGWLQSARQSPWEQLFRAFEKLETNVCGRDRTCLKIQGKAAISETEDSHLYRRDITNLGLRCNILNEITGSPLLMTIIELWL